MYGGHEKFIQNFGQKTSKENTTWNTKHIWEDNITVDLRKVG
jgi:hypothetical protein